MVYFWACEVSETKAAVVKIPNGFVLNVCNATLSAFVANDASTVSVGVETAQMDKSVWKGVVAHLGAAVHAHQIKLDLVFGGAQVKFYVAKGSGKVNVTGYFQPGPPAELFESVAAVEVAKKPETASVSSEKKNKSNKKRARDENVTWDQASSSSSEDESSTPAKTAKVIAKAAPDAAPQQKKEKAPVAAAPAPATGGDGSTKKKNRKKGKKSSEKKD
ncbi:hypothetical protein FI667_g10089, partial [Globisporangium splendens]